MRNVDTLFELEEISILLQYLYMSYDHKIVIDNRLTKLELYMTEECYTLARNLNHPTAPSLDYTEMMNVPNMLGIIDQLKNTPAVEFPTCFTNRWEEIKTIVNTNVAQNKMNQRERCWYGKAKAVN
jgi:hypothetical protein